MGKLIVEQIVSADGYAEDENGGIGFFADAGSINAADSGQMKMLSRTAAIVLGAKTSRMFAAWWPAADPLAEPVAMPIREFPKFVVSSTRTSAPWGMDDSAEILRGDGLAAVRSLRRRVRGDLIVWEPIAERRAAARGRG